MFRSYPGSFWCAVWLRSGLILALLSGVVLDSVTAQTTSPDEAGESTYYVYVSDKRIITAEIASSSKVVLNYINLDDVIELIESQGFLAVDEQGKGYRGHLFLRQEVEPSQSRYFLNELVKPSDFQAFDILGNFRFQAPLQKVYMQVGSRLIELEPIDSAEFDVFASKVSQLDLTVDSGTAVLEAGFWRGQGFLHPVGSEVFEEIQSRYPRPEPAPPVALATPQPRLLSKFADLPDPVIVQVRVQITAAGGILDPTIARSVNPELDQLAIQVVLNSWQFLPAIAQGKPTGAETVLNVQFLRE